MTKVITKKICLIGDFSVGKTSLVARFVNHTFSDKYLTTVGVSIKTRLLELNETLSIKLIIWDIAGEDAFSTASERYLKGANGLLMVADGTRERTLETSIKLLADAQQILGPVPHVSLLNKSDLPGFKDGETHEQADLENRFINGHIFTSAKTGANVEYAFNNLAGFFL